MMIKALLFDLDGTLLPMNDEKFTKFYLALLAKKFCELGYDGEKAIRSVWNGLEYMVANKGQTTNEDAFWKGFFASMKDELHHSKEELHQLLTSFYEHEFHEAKQATMPNEIAKLLIDKAKNADVTLILATNPIFPKVAVAQRLSWISLTVDDFDDVTSYETSHYCKPNPAYFQEILDKHQLTSDECIMFGNDMKEDIESASSIGIQSYLINDNPIGEISDHLKIPTCSLIELYNAFK